MVLVINCFACVCVCVCVCVFLHFLCCFVVAIFDLVHGVEAMFPDTLTANSIWKSFLK